MNFLNDFNKVAITVGSFIISILGGFLITSGLNNFYFFLGFETILFSLIASLLAYPSFISSIKLENPFAVDKSLLKGYFRITCFASWSLILGLVLLVTSFF